MTLFLLSSTTCKYDGVISTYHHGKIFNTKIYQVFCPVGLWEPHKTDHTNFLRIFPIAYFEDIGKN